jgi:hypothetical protein
LHPDAGSGAFKRLGVRAGVHPHDFPDVAVRIFDAAAEHEAVTLHRIGVGTTAVARENVAFTASRLSTLRASSA